MILLPDFGGDVAGFAGLRRGKAQYQKMCASSLEGKPNPRHARRPAEIAAIFSALFGGMYPGDYLTVVDADMGDALIGYWRIQKECRKKHTRKCRDDIR